jgi:hypothetical protein
MLFVPSRKTDTLVRSREIAVSACVPMDRSVELRRCFFLFYDGGPSCSFVVAEMEVNCKQCRPCRRQTSKSITWRVTRD